MRKLPGLLFILAPMFGSSAFGAPLCSDVLPANYQDLINLGSTGCQIGSLKFSDFTLQTNASSAGLVIPASGLGVTLESDYPGTGAYGFLFDPGMSVTGNSESQNEVLQYTVTAVTGFIYDMHLEFDGAVTGTGVTGVNEDYCPGLPDVSCGSPGLLSVVNPGSPGIFSQDVTFPGVTVVGVSKEINAMSGTNGTATISQVYDTFSTTSTSTPEPISIVLLGSGLLGLGLLRRRC